MQILCCFVIVCDAQELPTGFTKSLDSAPPRCDVDEHVLFTHLLSPTAHAHAVCVHGDVSSSMRRDFHSMGSTHE